MIPTNIIHRVFLCKNTKSSATCFSITYSGSIYYITAKHFLSECTNDIIHISYNEKWIAAKICKRLHSEVSDISVFIIDWEIPVNHIIASMDGLIYGQDIYFLGFPHGQSIDVGDLNRGLPVPFVKGGILSAMYLNKPGIPLFLDGHNNPGFSGGPIVFKNMDTNEIQVCGVISGKIDVRKPVYTLSDKSTDKCLYVEENEGIILGYSIQNAIDLIKNIQNI